ncbi:hypothetical protein EZ428_12240 [Pedobacter frigiditerrae]|uniref:Uncharacterized protein n=1 Tax=Pedobacter frigiditerrae TaxID=2530452 RepID=A0A4R0MV30_9SPHI|nr:hypothetical protein [Pedobacter frigiditerrae]TCC90052.1 hypothetical protein EZ428_12240 [Pedobacter frigiditerrae]
MKKKPASILDDNRISLAEAMDRTNFWRETIKPLFDDQDAVLPKGFYIPFEDIKALSELYPEAKGARAYFTLHQPGFKKGQGISAVLVPVLIDEAGTYKDIIEPATTDEEDSSIYDFTKPCPHCCDPESELS